MPCLVFGVFLVLPHDFSATANGSSVMLSITVVGGALSEGFHSFDFFYVIAGCVCEFYSSGCWFDCVVHCVSLVDLSIVLVWLCCFCVGLVLLSISWLI